MADMAASGPAHLAERVPAEGVTRRRWARRVAARLELRQVLGYDALSLLALSGLAVAQPLLDLFGKNPEFFVAAEATRGQIVTFALAVAFAIPLVCVLIEVMAHAIGHRFGAVVHAVLIGVLGTALGATVARQFDFSSNLPVVVISLGIGVVILLAEQRSRAMRLGLRYLALAPLLFLGLFLVTSATSRLLWEEEAQAATGVVVEDPRPVVMVVFDELPVASLLDADGQIDATRFPNFARLAEQATWFRNATSLSPNTPGSVPTIQSGLDPASGALPTSIDYPRNLFTLLGGTYDMDVTETITQLCPTTVCAQVSAESNNGWLPALGRALEDASVVYGHATLPPGLRAGLPGVDQSWGGFIEDAGGGADNIDGGPTSTTLPTTTTSRPGIDDFMTARNQQMATTQPQGTGELLRRMTERVGPETQSRLYFVHDGLFPHFNWLTTPDGRTYRGEGGPPGSVDGTWGDDEFLIRQGQQRHLLQVGYADTLLGDLLDRLEEEGIWDDAVVVVTADHGISFTADHAKRTPTDDTVDEIYRVPMLVRVPGVREGEVSDENAMNTDLLPTLVDVLGIHTDWEFDGRSLFGDDPAPGDKPVFYGSGPESVSNDLGGLFSVAQRNAERFPEPGWRGVAAVGVLGSLVGQPEDELDVTSITDAIDPRARWSLDHRGDYLGLPAEGGRVPLVLQGTLVLGIDEEPYDEALVVLNGRVAGVAGDFRRDGHRFRFRALLDFEQFQEGDNEVELLLLGSGEQPPTFLRVPLA